MYPDSNQGVSPEPPTEGCAVERVSPSIESSADYVTSAFGWFVIITFLVLLAASYLFTVISGAFPRVGSTLAIVVLISGTLNKYLHEPLHAYVGGKLGYSSEIEYQLFGGTTKFHNQWMKRNDRIITTLAPFLILSPVLALLIITVPNPSSKYLFAGFFILNSAGSAMDIADSISMLRMNTSNQIYIAEDGEKAHIWVARSSDD